VTTLGRTAGTYRRTREPRSVITGRFCRSERGRHATHRVYLSAAAREEKRKRNGGGEREKVHAFTLAYVSLCCHARQNKCRKTSSKRKSRLRNANFDHFSSGVDLFVSRNNRLPIRNQHNISVTHDDA